LQRLFHHHTAAFEALYNKKVDAGELNSAQLESAGQRGHYHDGDLVFLWKSDPIPTDPIAVRGDLPDGFKRRLVEVLQKLDLSSLDEKDRKVIMGGPRWVPQTDQAYDGIRDRAISIVCSVGQSAAADCRQHRQTAGLITRLARRAAACGWSATTPLKKITGEFATLSLCGSCVRLRITRYRGMNHAQDLTGCSGDFDDCPWSDQFAR
jgi:hypothetical protein